MTALSWLMIVAGWIGAVVFIVVRYQRKQAAREAEREKQLAILFAAAQAARKEAAGGAPAAAAAPGTSAAPASAPAAAPVYVARERLLAPQFNLVYLLLRAALPDHEIFVNLTLGDLVEAGPQGSSLEREHRARRLGQQRVDYVVCTRQLRVVAVVAMDGGAPADAAAVEAERLRNEALGAAGIRLMRIDPGALPKHPELRALVLGA